jgi:alpha-1,6-mannosyltransferase
VRWLGHVAGRDRLAALLATADVVLAPGPVETFGLAALEALACGTPVVVNQASALPEVVGDAGVAVRGTAEAFADGVRQILDRPEPERRAAARARAEQFGWPQAVEGFLRAHGAPLAPASARPAASLRPAVPVGAMSRVWATRAAEATGADDTATARYA